MGRLIDTSILIESERGRLDLNNFVTDRGNEGFFISVVTVSELLHGVHRAIDPHTKAKREANVESMLQEFVILDIDLVTARIHSKLWADLESAGETIGQNDFWLAATCVAKGLVMVTANIKHFRRIPGLEVEIWQ